LYISYSVVDDQRHKQPPTPISHRLLLATALKGMEPAPNPQ